MKSEKENNNPLEERLSRYRHRMELVRTVIGLVVLCIQVWLFFHLSK